MLRVGLGKTAAGGAARIDGRILRSRGSGVRATGSVVLLVGALLSGCVTSSETTPDGRAPRTAAAPAPRAPAFKPGMRAVRVLRGHGDGHADATATVKPTGTSAIPVPDEALLKRQPPPDCEMRTQPAGVGPTEVKLAVYDYERQCYRQVETVVRGRLDALQDAVDETLKALERARTVSRGHRN